jgi:hypothetical protein
MPACSPPFVVGQVFGTKRLFQDGFAVAVIWFLRAVLCLQTRRGEGYPVLQFQKDGSVPTGYEKAVKYWPPVITFRHPDYISERYPNEEVYDSSVIVDAL